VHPSPGDRLPGTFDQDVYVEIMRRFHDVGAPANGAITFTLHNFLRSLGRKADGRSYGLLRSALARLERTLLHSSGGYHDAATATAVHAHFTLLSSVSIERRRAEDHEQLPLFSAYSSSEPGEARVVVSPLVRANLLAGHTVTIDISTYLSLHSPVARRLYRLVQLARSGADPSAVSSWGVQVQELARMLPLTQKYPSHLLRVLVPAHEMLITAGVLREADVVQLEDGWSVKYTFSPDTRDQPFSPHGGRDLAESRSVGSLSRSQDT
jgi:plasmid replication initiation protein